MTNWIWITTEFIGFHKYPDAPDEVGFLRYRHRHIFKVKVYLEVFHNNRDVEFIMFKSYLNSLIRDSEMNDMSCEDIADYLCLNIAGMITGRKIKIEVSEDGENGVMMEYD